METRVEYLIENYMAHYNVSLEEAVKIMIEDLEAVRDENKKEFRVTKFKDMLIN